jgi:DNA recombination protein RmuC
MAELAVLIALVTLGVVAWLVMRMQRLLEEKHRAMLSDLHDGLTKQGDRLGSQLMELR